MLLPIKRLWAKKKIDSAEDLGTPLPPWVLQLIKEDPATGEYYAQHQALATRLRLGRDEWAQQNFPVESASEHLVEPDGFGCEVQEVPLPASLSVSRPIGGSPKGRRIRRAVLAGVLATAGLVFLVVTFYRSGDASSEREVAINRPQAEVQSNLSEPPDMRPFVATANASGIVAKKISKGANRVFSKWSSQVPLAEEEEREAIVAETRKNIRSTGGSVRRAIRSFALTLNSGLASHHEGSRR